MERPVVAFCSLTAHLVTLFFFSSRRRHTRLQGDWSSDVCSSDLRRHPFGEIGFGHAGAVGRGVDDRRQHGVDRDLALEFSGKRLGEAMHAGLGGGVRSEEHTSELQSPCNLVCRLLLEKKKKNDWSAASGIKTAPANMPAARSPLHNLVSWLNNPPPMTLAASSESSPP